MLRAGRLRERITIQSRTLTKDQYHEQSESWTDVCTVSASVVPQAAGESITADRPEVQQLLNITIRYRTGVTVQNRIKHVQGSETRYYEVLSVTNVGLRNRVLNIVASYKQDG